MFAEASKWKRISNKNFKFFFLLSLIYWNGQSNDRVKVLTINFARNVSQLGQRTRVIYGFVGTGELNSRSLEKSIARKSILTSQD